MAIKLKVREEVTPIRTEPESDIPLHEDDDIIVIKDYNLLENKPQVNGVTLEGDKTLQELGLVVDTQIINPLSNNPVANSVVAAKFTIDESYINVNITGIGVFVNFRNMGQYHTFAELTASAEFKAAIQKPVNVYYYGMNNYVGQALIFTGVGSGFSPNWTIQFADAFEFNGEYVDGLSGTIATDGYEWFLDNWVFHKPVYIDLLAGKQNTLTFDNAPREGSDNPVTSGGVYTAISSVEAEIPPAQVNSDWNANSGVAQILNKPTIPEAQVNADWNASSGVAEILNKPTIPAAPVNADWNANSGLAQILNKPTIPAAQVNADWNASSGVAEILNKPTIPAAQVNSDWNANSGVAQILNKPTIPAAQVNADWNANSGVEEILNKPTKTSAFQNDGSDGTAAYLETDETAFRTARIPYGKCDNTSTSTAYTATVPGITELKDGVFMLLYNGVVTSASGFTININGLGAKPSYNNMTMGNPVTPTNPTRDTTIFNINYAFLFVYSETLVSGGCWIGYRGYDANTNTIGYQLRTNNSTMPTADKFYRYRLLFTSADGSKWVPANTSTSTNATSTRTPNTRAIDPFGEIAWYGTTTVIEANANVTAAQLWQEYYGSYTNIGYSFNNTGAAATMTANKPIYIKCTPQADGSAVIDPTTPYTQDLPTTADGKIYIYLGRAYNATNFEITMKHPVYYYHNGGIRLWTGQTFPDAPTTDGTYKLTCTVLNGTPTYTWEV